MHLTDFQASVSNEMVSLALLGFIIIMAILALAGVLSGESSE